MQLILPDACRGPVESIADYLPDARWQRCMVHFHRNVFSHVPTTKVRDISHMLKAIHAEASREAAQEKAATMVEDLRRRKLGKAAGRVEVHIDDTLGHCSFPDSHRLKIRTRNPLERIIREIRRRPRVVGAFPDGQSCLNRAAARLRHIAASQWSTRMYMTIAPLHAEQASPQRAVAWKNVRKIFDTNCLRALHRTWVLCASCLSDALRGSDRGSVQRWR